MLCVMPKKKKESETLKEDPRKGMDKNVIIKKPSHECAVK